MKYSSEGKNGWFLGIISRKPPKEIIRMLVNILNTLGYSWKINSNIYRLKCRKKYEKEELIIGVQLFKIRSKSQIHLLDFKLVVGKVFTFFGEYTKIQKEIRSLNFS